jgi:multiple sugar transport system permease protein
MADQRAIAAAPLTSLSDDRARRRKPLGRVTTVLAYVVLFAGAFVMLVPFVWMVSASLMPLPDILHIPPHWIPPRPTLDNFRTVWTERDFGRYFLNSVIVAVGTVGGTLLTSVLAGYAFAKYQFPGKRVLFILVLATMMIPFQVRMVPLYSLFADMRLLDTYAALILPFTVSGFGIFLMRQFIQSIPTELIYAARVDGAGELRILFGMIVPQLKPALAALTIFSFFDSWDSYLWPLIAASSPHIWTLPLAMARFREQYLALTNLQMAGAVIAVVPAIALFMVLQKHFVQGVALTGMKG